MMSEPAFCMNCFTPIAAGDAVCRACGARVSEISRRDYREKLLHALEHPLADVRSRAIHALGLRAEEASADALARCALKHPVDIVQGLLVIGALRAVGGTASGRRALTLLEESHPAHAIRHAACTALAGTEGP